MSTIADPIADSIAYPVGAEERRRRGPLADFFYRLVREKPLGLLGAVIIVVFVLVSVFANVLAPDPEQRQDVTRRLQGSSAEHLLGTDHTGRDFLSRNIGAMTTVSAVTGWRSRSVTSESLTGWPRPEQACFAWGPMER